MYHFFILEQHLQGDFQKIKDTIATLQNPFRNHFRTLGKYVHNRISRLKFHVFFPGQPTYLWICLLGQGSKHIMIGVYSKESCSHHGARREKRYEGGAISSFKGKLNDLTYFDWCLNSHSLPTVTRVRCLCIFSSEALRSIQGLNYTTSAFTFAEIELGESLLRRQLRRHIFSLPLVWCGSYHCCPQANHTISLL